MSERTIGANEILSLVRDAYISGFMKAAATPAALGSNYEYVRAHAEAFASPYVDARAENDRHPLAQHLRWLASQAK